MKFENVYPKATPLYYWIFSSLLTICTVTRTNKTKEDFSPGTRPWIKIKWRLLRWLEKRLSMYLISISIVRFVNCPYPWLLCASLVQALCKPCANLVKAICKPSKGPQSGEPGSGDSLMKDFGLVSQGFFKITVFFAKTVTRPWPPRLRAALKMTF